MHLRSVFRPVWQVAIIQLAAVLAFADEPPKRHPVPDEAAQAAAMKLVHEVYGADLDAAKTADQKKALAKKLLAKAQSSGDDRTGKYVLLKAAKSIAVLAADADTAFEAIDSIAESFEIDALPMKANALDGMAHKARFAADQVSIAQHALGLINAAIAAERFDLAGQLGQLALETARTGAMRNCCERHKKKSPKSG